MGLWLSGGGSNLGDTILYAHAVRFVARGNNTSSRTTTQRHMVAQDAIHVSSSYIHYYMHIVCRPSVDRRTPSERLHRDYDDDHLVVCARDGTRQSQHRLAHRTRIYLLIEPSFYVVLFCVCVFIYVAWRAVSAHQPNLPVSHPTSKQFSNMYGVIIHKSSSCALNRTNAEQSCLQKHNNKHAKTPSYLYSKAHVLNAMHIPLYSATTTICSISTK